MERINNERLSQIRERRGTPLEDMELVLLCEEVEQGRKFAPRPAMLVAEAPKLTCFTCGQPQVLLEEGRCGRCRANITFGGAGRYASKYPTDETLREFAN